MLEKLGIEALEGFVLINRGTGLDLRTVVVREAAKKHLGVDHWKR